MLERCPVPAGGIALEVGCGSGRLLQELGRMAAFGALVGVDPEPAMLAIARGRGIDALLGRAERLPVRTGSVDLCYAYLALHLVQDQRAAAREMRRVVRQRGFAAIWTLTPEHVLDFHLNRLFPSLAEIDLKRFPSPEELAGQLVEAGFETVAEQELVSVRRTSAGRLAEAVRRRYISTLALIPTAELAAGSARLDREAAADPARAVTYRQRWCLVWARAGRSGKK